MCYLQVKKLLSEHEPFRYAFDSRPDIAEVVLESAIELAWIMSTLLPPASACEPTVYYQEWQELVTTLDSTVNPETDTAYKLIYCRPVLFFGAEGTIGKPGAVKCLPLPQVCGDEAKTTEKQLLSSRDCKGEFNLLEGSGSLCKLVETAPKKCTLFTADGAVSSQHNNRKIPLVLTHCKSSNLVLTSDEQHNTPVFTSPVDNKDDDGAKRKLPENCKNNAEEEMNSDDSKCASNISTGEQEYKATSTTNPTEDRETLSCTEINGKSYDQKVQENASSDAIQSSEDRVLLSALKPDTACSDLPPIDFGQQ